METKQCSACNTTLTLDNFTLSGRSANNYKGVAKKLRYSSRCKPCAATYAREWRSANPEYGRSRVRGRVLDSTKLLHSFIKARLCDAKARAKKYGKPYDIDFEYAMGLYTGYCAISKLPLPMIKGDLDVASLDCIEPKLGYVRWQHSMVILACK